MNSSLFDSRACYSIAGEHVIVTGFGYYFYCKMCRPNKIGYIFTPENSLRLNFNDFKSFKAGRLSKQCFIWQPIYACRICFRKSDGISAS